MSPPDTPSSHHTPTALAGPESGALARAATPLMLERTEMGQRSWSGTLAGAESDDIVGTTLCQTYAVERVLGEGGMGRVYVARHTRIKNKRFAVKMLHPEFLRNKEAIARFFREAETAALITSPNVVGVIDVDRAADGRPFLVCEYLEGIDLGDRIQAVGKLGVPQSVWIVRQICRGLNAAHKNGIVHRDIKPENVFLTGDVERPLAKVLDFGISRLEESESSSLTKTGSIMGTPAYMAPEQARGEVVDARADVYAVGAILFTVLTGRAPFVRENPTAMLAAVLLEEPERPRTLEPTIPPALEAVIQRAMAKSKDERFGSVQELDRALAPFDSASDGARREGAHSEEAKAAVATDAADARDVGQARPMLLSALTAACALVLVGFLASVEALLRALGVSLTTLQFGLMVGGLLATLATPAWLLVRYLRGRVWDNVLRVLELGRAVRVPLLAGLAAMGAAALLMRFLERVVLGRDAGAAWPLWDPILFVVALTVAGAVAAGRARRTERTGAGAPREVGLGAMLGGLVAVTGVVVATATLREDGGEPQVAELSVVGGADVASAPSDADSSAPAPDEAKALAKLRRAVLDLGEAQKYEEALERIEELFERSPEARTDKPVVAVLRKAAQYPGDVGQRALEIMGTKMGEQGPELLWELTSDKLVGTGAERQLQRAEVQEKASPALRIALELRDAKGCLGKAPLLERAAKEGDERSVKVLEPLTYGSKSGCGILGMGSCPPPCGNDTPKIRAAIQAIRARAGQ